MTKTLLLTMAILLCASLVFAQAPGSIALFSDPGATNCNALDQGPGLFSVYVFHMFTTGATASQFMVQQADGAALTYLSDNPSYPVGTIGNTQTGIIISYGGCFGSPNQLVIMTYFASGLSATCSKLIVVPHPTAIPPGLLVADCAVPANLLVATGGSLIINPDPTCDCNVPTEDSTWGRLKSLYVVE